MTLPIAYDKQKTLPKYGLAIDFETSGADWDGDSSQNYQAVSFGAIIFDTSDLSEVETLYREIKFDEARYKWSPEAERVHGLSIDHLRKNGVTMEEAAEDLLIMIHKWIFSGEMPGSETSQTRKTIMFLGHNIEFDIRFTAQLLEKIGFILSRNRPVLEEGQIWIRPHHVQLDTSGTGFINLGLFKSDLLFDALGFETRGQHNALEDIRMTLTTAQLFRQMFTLL